jgi:hypothetical protein
MYSQHANFNLNLILIWKSNSHKLKTVDLCPSCFTRQKDTDQGNDVYGASRRRVTMGDETAVDRWASARDETAGRVLAGVQGGGVVALALDGQDSCCTADLPTGSGGRCDVKYVRRGCVWGDDGECDGGRRGSAVVVSFLILGDIFGCSIRLNNLSDRGKIVGLGDSDRQTIHHCNNVKRWI